MGDQERKVFYIILHTQNFQKQIEKDFGGHNFIKKKRKSE